MLEEDEQVLGGPARIQFLNIAAGLVTQLPRSWPTIPSNRIEIRIDAFHLM